MAVYERIPYIELTAQEREALHEWCELHGIDHTTVPLDARIERADNGDWLVEAHDQRNGNAYVDGFGNVVKVTLRRTHQADLPWPTRAVS